MMQMNNALMYLLDAAQRGANPLAVVQKMAQNNPQMQQFASMINGKSPQQLEQIARNMAKERGIDLNQLARQLKINLPK